VWSQILGSRVTAGLVFFLFFPWPILPWLLIADKLRLAGPPFFCYGLLYSGLSRPYIKAQGRLPGRLEPRARYHPKTRNAQRPIEVSAKLYISSGAGFPISLNSPQSQTQASTKGPTKSRLKSGPVRTPDVKTRDIATWRHGAIRRFLRRRV